jgi:hypothetical protein
VLVIVEHVTKVVGAVRQAQGAVKIASDVEKERTEIKRALARLTHASTVPRASGQTELGSHLLSCAWDVFVVFLGISQV